MNKHIGKLWMWLVLLCSFTMVACSDDDDEAYQYITQEGSSTYVLKGYGDAGFNYTHNLWTPLDLSSPIYISDSELAGSQYSYAAVNAERLDAVTTIPESGYEATAPIKEGALYVAKNVTTAKLTYLKLRIVSVIDNEVTIEYAKLGEEVRPNGNANEAEGTNTYVTRLEMPHRLTSNNLAVHTVTVDGEEVMNLAIEWNDNYKHAQWVAFTFDKITAFDANIGRTDAWASDALLPESMRVDNSYHTSDGFDRGHLCASEDRQYLKEANQQTFLYSNMSPQMSSFNSGVWAKMEAQVQSWGQSVNSLTYDEIYVAKGGTLNNLLKSYTGTKKSGDGLYPTTDASGFTTKGLACPAYYYMAILAKKGTEYQAIAFLVPHDETIAASTDYSQYVVTIDKLEEATGVDFFCNLPDDVESSVESYTDKNLWTWLNAAN
jgi:endonuclease G